MTASKTVTVRLNEQQIARVDQMVEVMRRNQRFALSTANAATRSDALRVFITGWLMDHGETLDRMLKELEGEQP